MFLTRIHGLIRFYLGNNELDSIKKIGLLIVGWLFVVLGIIGLFLPILQGILFILIGLAILSTRSEIVKRILKNLEERYPHYYKQVEIWKEKIWSWFRKR
jgi:uncharacterized membrane protein YbaN (DUF454 family)